MSPLQFIGVVGLAFVFAFITYQFIHGGGKKENGHEPGSYW